MHLSGLDEQLHRGLHEYTSVVGLEEQLRHIVHLSGLDEQPRHGLHENTSAGGPEEQLHHGRHESMSIRTYSASARA